MEDKTGQSCPLCSQDMGAKPKLLYEHFVCKKCHTGFANRRQIAFVVDLLLWLVFIITPIAVLMRANADEVRGLQLLLSPVFMLKDGFSGYSPGKVMMGVRTMKTASDKPAGFFASFLRNLPLIIPFMVLIVGARLKDGKRYGDGWAKTRVIWNKYRSSVLFAVKD